jgi:single-strand DNA-binding protein
MNLNKVMLAGNLTRDPELRHTSGNTAVCSFTVASNLRWKDASGQAKEETTFIDCEAWGAVAETIAKYMSKGKPIFVEGRLRTDEWEDKQTGQKRSKLKVVVDSFQFVGPRDSAGVGGGASGGGSRPSGGSKSQSRHEDDADDLPF